MKTGLLYKIFAAALVVRWTYALLLFAAMGDGGLKGADSVGYLDLANEFAAAIASGGVHGFEWLGPSPAQMPLFSWLLALAGAFGTAAALVYVLLQSLFDAGTCVLIYLTARFLDERYALPAALAAIFNPTLIVLSGLVYGDTPFVFFVALFLYAALRWMRDSSWRWAITLGFAVAAAMLLRVYAIFWLPVTGLYMVAVVALQHRLRRQHVGQIAAAMLIVALALMPVVWRNVSEFGVFALTPQGGEHLARHVVPFLKEVKDGTPRLQTVTDVDRRRQERYGPMPTNLFEQSRQFTAIGREDLDRLGAVTLAKSWMLGAAINLGTPALIISPPIAQLPRTGFFATPGPTPLDKIENFLFRSDNAVYVWACCLASQALPSLVWCNCSARAQSFWRGEIGQR